MSLISTIIRTPKTATAPVLGGATGAADPTTPTAPTAPVGGVAGSTPTNPVGTAVGSSPATIIPTAPTPPPPPLDTNSPTPIADNNGSQENAAQASAQPFHSDKTNQNYGSQAEMDAAETAFDIKQNQSQSAQNPGNNGTTPTTDTSTATTPKTPNTSTPWDELLQSAKDMMNATEDPTSTITFNKSISKLTMANAAQQAVLKSQIAANPALRDQPVGTAILGLAAAQAGSTVADLVAKLGIEEVKNIQNLNQFGFDKAQAILQQQQQYKVDNRNALLQAGDYDGYAAQMQADTGILPDVSELKASSPGTVAAAGQLVESIKRAEALGTPEGDAQAQKLFTQLQGLQPKTYGNLSLRDLVSAQEQYNSHKAQNDTVMTNVRASFLAGDIPNVVSGLQSLQSEAESEAAGKVLAQGIGTDAGMTFDEATRLLRQSGAIPATESITSEADLVGLYDDLNIAKQLDGIKNGANGANSIDHAISTYATMLGVDKLDPVATANMRSFLLNNPFTVDPTTGALTFNNSSITMPWDSTNATNKSSHLYSDWPIVAGVGQAPAYAGWQLYDDNTNTADEHLQHPKPGDPTYDYTNTLDKAYEAYTRSSDYTAQPMSREDWFAKVSNNPDNWKGGKLTADPSTGALSLGAAVKPTVTVPKTYDAVNAGAFITQNFTGKTQDEIGSFLSDPNAVKASIVNKAIPDLSDPSSIKYDEADYVAKAAQANGWIAGPGGKAYHMDKPPGGDAYNAVLNGVGWGFMMTGTDGKKYFMVTRTISGGQPVGKVLPLTESTNRDDVWTAKNGLLKGALSAGNKSVVPKSNDNYYYAGGA